VVGAVMEDRETGTRLRVDARVVINATGVFTDQVTRLDEPGAPDRIAASQGIHLVLDAAYLGGASALMIPKTSDGRVLFAIPWLGRVIYGTTDTPRDIIEDHPAPLESEIDYLLAHAPHIFARPLTRAEVIASFAGLRPLPKADGKRSSEVSRDFHVTVSPAGLVSVYGGKLTTCRAMGEAAVEQAAALAGLPAAPSRTNELLLLDEGQPASHLTAPSREDVAYAVEYEMARTVDDLLLRRSRVGLLNPAVAYAAAPLCAAWLAELRSGEG
jgi:glycerol-3-phosphate dehydrogenase